MTLKKNSERLTSPIRGFGIKTMTISLRYLPYISSSWIRINKLSVG